MSFSQIVELPTGLGGAKVGDLLSAAVALVLCLCIIRFISGLLRRVLGRGRADVRMQKYILKGAKLVLWIVAALIVLECLHVEATSLVALISVLSLGLTLAAEDILGNMVGGVIILTSHPFSIGDFIEAGGTCGTVEEITLNHTKIITPDGLTALIPSKTVADSKVVNYTALGKRRVCREVTASYDAPTETVKGACGEALAATDKILAEPPSSVRLADYGASSIKYAVYCWCRPEDYWDVYYSLGENLRAAFGRAGVEMTYDHLNVHIADK